MKKLVSLVLVVVVLMPLALTPFPVSAQTSRTCTQEQLEQWWIAIIGLVDRYGQAIAETSSLPAIATIQAIRREFDAIVPPACDLLPTPEVVADMFNLRTDSLVLHMLGDAQAATLGDQADDAYQQVIMEMGDVNPPTPTASGEVVTAITSPSDGETVPQETNVQGTVNPDVLAENGLWLFIFAADGKYYPQVGDACNNPSAIPVREGRTRWALTAYIGDASNVGDYFELVLGTLTEDVSQEFLAEMPAWCNAGFPGFTPEQIFEERQFNELSIVGVTRQ